MARPGHTRANVVVLLLIATLVGGLIVTAVDKTREAAARAKCGNNLKQLAVGLHAYHDVNGRLPPLVDVGEGSPTGRGLPSACSSLCLYLEAYPWQFRGRDSPADAYHAHSSTTFRYGQKDREEPAGVLFGGDANRIFRVFLCPSDATGDQLRDVPMTLPDGSTGYYAAGSYAVNGLLPWNAGKFLPVETILFAERPQVCRTTVGETVYNLWGVGFYSPHLPAFAALAPGPASTGQVAPVVPLPDHEDELRVRIGTTTADPRPVDFAAPFQRVVPGWACDPRLPGTPHRAGLQAAMADGSVRTFAVGTSPWVFWSACVPSPKGP